MSRAVDLGFDPKQVFEDLKTEDPDEDGVKTLFLGTVFSLCPSGKYYTPWASGNLGACPVCKGSGKRSVTMKRRLIVKHKNRDLRLRRTWIKRYDHVGNWPSEVLAYSDRLNRQTCGPHSTTCHRCRGSGSAEAADDEDWWEAAEKALSEYGVSIGSSEGDPCDIIATLVEDPPEEDSGNEEGFAEPLDNDDNERMECT